MLPSSGRSATTSPNPAGHVEIRMPGQRARPVAAAMIDRLVHHAEVLTLTGDPYRTRQRREILATNNRAQRD